MNFLLVLFVDNDWLLSLMLLSLFVVLASATESQTLDIEAVRNAMTVGIFISETSSSIDEDL